MIPFEQKYKNLGHDTTQPTVIFIYLTHSPGDVLGEVDTELVGVDQLGKRLEHDRHPLLVVVHPVP
eukprot:478184-Pyramimonas_sp.AAC.2